MLLGVTNRRKKYVMNRKRWGKCSDIKHILGCRKSLCMCRTVSGWCWVQMWSASGKWSYRTNGVCSGITSGLQKWKHLEPVIFKIFGVL